MDASANLQTVAALLERSYRLALVLKQAPTHDSELSAFVAAELLDVLDEARVGLFVASGLARRAS